MKDIRIIQYEKVREQYQNIIKLASTVFSMHDVEILKNEILSNNLETPLCGKYRVENNSNIDIKSMNAEMALMKADIESIFTYMGDISYKHREMQYVVNTYTLYASEKIKQANRDLQSMSNGKFINGLTYDINFLDYINEKLSTAKISDNHLCMPVSSSKHNDHIFTSNDISISRIGPEYTVEIIGNPVDLFTPGNSKLIMRLYPKTNTNQTCGFKIDISASLKNINYIFIRMEEPRVGMKLSIDTLDNNKYKTIYNNVVNTDIVDVFFTNQDVNKISLNFTMDIPNTSVSGKPYYEWIIYSTRMLNIIKDNDCVFVSKKIPVDPDINSIQLVAEDETDKNSSIKYYLTTQLSSAGEPTAFTEITNSDNIFTIGIQNHKYNLSPKDDVWNLSRKIIKGKRLYNLLDGVENVEYGPLKIENGKITISGDNEIIQNSIKLYNGIDNYLITNEDSGKEYNGNNISYQTIYNTDIEWVKSIPLRINIDQEPIEHVSYNQELNVSSIYLKYKIAGTSPDYIRIYDSDNIVSPNNIILPINNNNILLVTGEITIDSNLYINYITELSDFSNESVKVELDYNSIYVSVNGITYEQYTDYLIHSSHNLSSIELLKTGKYSDELDIAIDPYDEMYNNSPNVNITYKFKAYDLNIKKSYTTNLYCNQFIDMTILPFSPEEVAMGNYHIINTFNVSTHKKYTLSPGWNQIKTSQPYPSNLNIYKDVNQYTEKPTAAGIILPVAVDAIQPYLDSMKQISSFILSTSNKEDRECFAYEDGYLYINYPPEFLSPDLLNDPYYGNISGSRFLCKKAEYDIDNKNTIYLPVPEQFILELKYKDSSENRDIYVKIELSSSGTNSNAKVNRLGLNMFKED